jgi:uncharacterized protein YlxP (DUF503 family)
VNAVHILRLTLEFQLPACHSLKDKRRRLGGLREKFGGKPNIAVTESGWHDVHDRARWTFVVVGENQRVVESTQESILSHARQSLDAILTHSSREYLG